jgi:ABC-type multidrug transport system fused ATPase/permease subunit
VSSWQLLARSLEYVGPAKGWFALKAALALLSLLPLLLLPWPVKLVVDHVAQGIPIGAQPLPYPGWLAPLVAPLTGAATSEVLLACVLAQLALAVLVGAVGMSATERGVADSRLASGFDRASQTENEANEGTSLASGLVGLADALFTIRLTQRLNHHYRSRVFARIQRLPLRALEEASIGDSLFRVLYDTPALTQAVYRIVIEPVVVLCFGGIVAFTLWRQFGPHPRLWQIALALLALALVVSLPFAAVLRRRSDASRRAGADTTATLEESLHNVLAVQSLGAEGREKERFSGASFRAFESFRGLLVVGMGALAVGLVPATALLAYAFLYIGDLVIAGELTPGDFLLLTTYFGLIAFVCLDLGAMWLRLQDAAAGLARTAFLLDLPGEDEAARAAPPRLRQGIRMENVAVALPDGTRVLAGIDLEIPVGRVIALVGPAGAGKTTLAQLLPRFLEPSAGRVLWDGVDCAGLDLAGLRAQIGFVFQETQLFDATIEENLRVGKPDASEAELWSALASAGAEGFVRALPTGLATPLGRSGGALSVGQRQRLAIARALVRDAPLLVLDEPTSGLDPETERRLVASLRAASRARAVLVIAHRLSTIRDADTICFLEAGRIIERGSHAELLARAGGAYRAFVELQARG